jgi:transposase
MMARPRALTPTLAARYYLKAGWPQAQIAARYQVSQMTVSRYLRRLGIHGADRRRVRGLSEAERMRRLRLAIPPETAAQIRALRQEGESIRGVARRLQLPLTTCWKWVRALEETP